MSVPSKVFVPTGAVSTLKGVSGVSVTRASCCTPQGLTAQVRISQTQSDAI